MPSYTALIVGAYHHPPAKALLTHLPGGAALSIIPEPENPYDSNALGVWTAPSAIPEAQLEDLIPVLDGYGISREEFLSTPLWMLGYINARPPKTNPTGWCAATLAPLLRTREPTAKLGFTPEGTPTIVIHMEPLQ